MYEHLPLQCGVAMKAKQFTERQQMLKAFLDRVWSSGEIDACDYFLAGSYTLQHDPGDHWDGQTLDLARFKERVRLSRAPFPDQRFEVQEWFETTMAWL